MAAGTGGCSRHASFGGYPAAVPSIDQRASVVDLLHEADEQLFAQVAELEAPLLDRTLPPLSEIASRSVLWFAISALVATFGGRDGRRAAIAGLAGVAATSALANVVFKGLTRRERPSIEVPKNRRLPHPTSSSFPSGHTASAAAFSGVVGKEIPVLSLPLNTLAGAVGLSRVYTGVHYPGDVLAGWILGKIVASVVVRVADRIEKRFGPS
jgi:membrane-associated phospholipid phosphatase